MASSVLFFLFAGLAIACAISMVYHKNPLYSAISLIGVFLSLSCIYITLAAPFIAAVQVLIYAGAIMVLVVFVIMLLNLDEKDPVNRLGYLYAVGGGLGLILLVQTFFIFYAVSKSPVHAVKTDETVGKTLSLGSAMYTRISAAGRNRGRIAYDGDHRRCDPGAQIEPAAARIGGRRGIGKAERKRRLELSFSIPGLLWAWNLEL